jgi:hypothetical protein
VVDPAADAVATFLAWVLSQAARPIFWLVDRLGIDPDRVREFLESLREGSARRAFERQGAGEPSIWQRMLGFLVFAAIEYAVVRAIRHFRPPVGAEPEPHAPGTQTESAIPVVETVPAWSLFRRELPADAVRRWYAETLLALRELGIIREPWQTPTEFAHGGRGGPGLRDRVREADARVRGRPIREPAPGSARAPRPRERSEAHRRNTPRRLTASVGWPVP